MKETFFYFDIHHAVEDHDWIIENSGGLQGINNLGLLESALQHIQNELYERPFPSRAKLASGKMIGRSRWSIAAPLLRYQSTLSACCVWTLSGRGLYRLVGLDENLSRNA